MPESLKILFLQRKQGKNASKAMINDMKKIQ